MKKIPFVASFVATLLLAAVGRAAPTSVPLENPANDFVVNPATGVLAVVETDKDVVRFYPRLSSDKSANTTTSLPTPKGPIGVIFKKFGKDSFFLVVSRDASKVLLIDATSLKPVKDIPLSVSAPTLIVASLNPDDPYVYVPGNPDGAARGVLGSNVAAIDLRVQKSVGAVSLGGDLGGRMSDGALAADGRIAYARATNVSPTGFSATAILRADEGKPPVTSSLFRDHRSVNGYVPDPFGQSVAVGTEIYSADLKQQLGSTETPIACYHPNRPFMFALRTAPASTPAVTPTSATTPAVTPGRGARAGAMGIRSTGAQNDLFLSVLSYNTLKIVASVDLGPEPAGSSSTGARGNFATRPAVHVLVDPKNDNVLVCDENAVRVVAFKELNVPNEPFLVATVEGNTQLTVGKPASLKVLAKDPAAKLELKDAPKGMTLSGNAIVWTPGPDDIGEVTAALRISAGAADRTQQFTLQVGREFIRLPFTPTALEVSPDGATALVATTSAQGLPMDPSGSPANANSHLALIDLKTSAVLADRTLLANASLFAIDAEYVYAALRDSEAFYILSRKDLSEVKRLFTQGHASAFLPRADKLAVTTDSGAIYLFSLTDFSPIDSPAVKANSNSDPFRDRNREALVDLGDAVLLNGIIYDANLDKIKAVARLDALRTISMENRNFMPDNGNRFSLSRWGVGLNFNGALVRPDGRQAGQFNANGSCILSAQPVVASFVLTARQGGGGTIRQGTVSRGDLVFRDVIAGTPQQTVRILDENLQLDGQRNSFPDRQQVPLRPAGNKVALLVADRIYLLDLPPLDAAKFPAPPQFATDQGVVILSSTKPTTVGMTATASAGAVEYSLSRELPGIDIDKATGIVTIQPNAFLDRAVDLLAGQGNPVDVPSYQKTAGAAFKNLTGRDPAGIPVAVSFTVTARDKSLQSSTTDRLVLLEVPPERLTQKLAAAQPTARPPGPATFPASRPTDPADANARIQTLEKRIDALEAKIDLLTKLLTESRSK